MLAFLHGRRSVRRFLDRAIPADLLNRILETATWAPSAHNSQPWRFVVPESPESRRRLAYEMGEDFRRDLSSDGLPMGEVEKRIERSRNRILEAPAVILVCLDQADLDSYPDPERQQAELWMGIQSVALAGGTLLLAAHAEGLGGVWVCAPLFAPQTVRRVLTLPDSWIPQGMVLLGYPAGIPEPRPRKPVHQITIFR